MSKAVDYLRFIHEEGMVGEGWIFIFTLLSSSFLPDSALFRFVVSRYLSSYAVDQRLSLSSQVLEIILNFTSRSAILPTTNGYSGLRNHRPSPALAF